MISQSSLLWRTAVWSDERLLEYREEPREEAPLVGSVVRGRVMRKLESLKAVSVDFGTSQPGFLPLEDISQESLLYLGYSGRIPDDLKKGQELLVQVARTARGEKGARLTGKFSLPGRYWVYLPTAAPEILISKKLVERDLREKIRNHFTPLLKERGGLVLRSVAPLDSLEELVREFEGLASLWEKISGSASSLKTGDVAHRDWPLPFRALREQLSQSCSEILVDDISLMESLNELIEGSYASLRGMVRFAGTKRPLFEEFPVDSQLARAAQRKVLLPSGGSLIFDQTEAMCVVDVNAGIPDERDAPHFRTNIEAALELGIQLRLRDITGIIVVDFINMKGSRDRRKIEEAVRASLRPDPVKNQVYGMTELYLLQIVRSAGRRESRTRMTEPCETCHGRGVVPSMYSQALRALHQVERLLMREDVGGVEIQAANDFLAYLSSELSGTAEMLREKYKKRIVLSPGSDYHFRECRIRAMHDLAPH